MNTLYALLIDSFAQLLLNDGKVRNIIVGFMSFFGLANAFLFIRQVLTSLYINITVYKRHYSIY